MSTTAQLGITELVLSQAGKEITINEAHWRLDAFVQSRIVDLDLSQPDGNETEGDLYYVAAPGTGLWTGHDAELAHYYNGSWHFYTLQIGMRFWITDEAVLKIWNGATWETVMTT